MPTATVCATPLKIVREIYRIHNLEWTPEMAGRTEFHAGQNPKNRHGNMLRWFGLRVGISATPNP